MREVEDGLLLRWQEDADGVYVPEGVTTIGKGLFRGNTAIRSIDIPESVRTIGDFAFEDCRALERVTLHDGLKRLGDGCFRGCVSLKNGIDTNGVCSRAATTDREDSVIAMIVLVTGMDRQGRFTGPFHESADGQFQVCDPLSRKITLTEAELERYMDTPVGKAALAVFEQMPSKTGEMI